MAEMVFSKILIKSLNLAENPYKIPKFGGKTNYIQKIGGDIISRNSTFFMYVHEAYFRKAGDTGDIIPANFLDVIGFSAKFRDFIRIYYYKKLV